MAKLILFTNQSVSNGKPFYIEISSILLGKEIHLENLFIWKIHSFNMANYFFGKPFHKANSLVNYYFWKPFYVENLLVTIPFGKPFYIENLLVNNFF